MYLNDFSEIRTVLILKADKLSARILQQLVQAVAPGAEFRLVFRVMEAVSATAGRPVDLLITGIGMADGDTLDFLETGLRERWFKHVVVVTGRQEQRMLSTLRSLGVRGVFDPATEEPEQLEWALRTVIEGKLYWSQSLLDRLDQRNTPAASVCRTLTPLEQLVLAVVGDGSSDEDASERLGLRPSSVQSIRRSLHRKLGVQHKGDLVRLAAQYGFVRFTADNVVRPGYTMLMAAYAGRGASARKAICRHDSHPRAVNGEILAALP